MDHLDHQVLDAMARWQARGHRFALVTVARTWGSAPRQPGAWLALCDDGRVAGSVSGGCIEDDLIARMKAGEFAADGLRPSAVTYGGHPDATHRWGLPCGGTLALVIEPRPDLAALQRMQAGIRQGQRMRRVIDLPSGEVHIAEAPAHVPDVQWDGQTLSTVHGPRWRLLLIGANQTARYLTPIAQTLGFAVQVCDPRPEYHTEWDLPDAPWLPGMPDDVVLALRPDAHTAVVTLTHDPKLDDLALIEALRSPALYVGAVGSLATSQRRRERLHTHFDLSDAELERLHGPVGLPIGSRTPAEIAVAIAAELTAVRSLSRRGEGAAQAAASLPVWPASTTPACTLP